MKWRCVAHDRIHDDNGCPDCRADIARRPTLAEGFARIDDPVEPVCNGCGLPDRLTPSWACGGVPEHRCAYAARRPRLNAILQCVTTAKEFHNATVFVGPDRGGPHRVLHRDGRQILP